MNSFGTVGAMAPLPPRFRWQRSHSGYVRISNTSVLRCVVVAAAKRDDERCFAASVDATLRGGTVRGTVRVAIDRSSSCSSISIIISIITAKRNEASFAADKQNQHDLSRSCQTSVSVGALLKLLDTVSACQHSSVSVGMGLSPF